MKRSILLHTAMKWLLLFSLYLALPGLAAEASTMALEPELRSISAQAFHALYQMDYKTAKRHCQRMIDADARHPAGYIYLASAVWLEHLSGLRRLQTQLYNRTDEFFRQDKDPVDPLVEKTFYTNVEKGLVRAKMRLRSNPNDPVGLYFLGTGHGAVAGYEGTVKRTFLSSLKHGSEAADAHRKLLKQDPEFADAYLSIGLFNYVLGRLPLSVKVLMMLGGMHGSREEGLKQLERAYKHGKLARDEAAALLVILYDREKRYAESLQLLKELTMKYPANPLFQFETATMLTKMGRFTESQKIYEKLLTQQQARDYLQDFIHFEYAELLFATANWQRAYAHYLNSRRVMRNTPVGLITMSHLRAGQCLNAMGRHDEAAKEYAYVLKQPEIQGSKALARQYLKQPYQLIPLPAKR